MPDPVAACVFAAWGIGSAPIHDHCPDRDLAEGVFRVVGITGKVVVHNLPQVVLGPQGALVLVQGENLPASVGHHKSEVGVQQDSEQRTVVFQDVLGPTLMLFSLQQSAWGTALAGLRGRLLEQLTALSHVCMYACMYVCMF